MADIGFSMGIAGTEVAKEASSIILMDDSFSSVVKATMWGRSVNDSVKKFLQFQLAVNVSAVTVSFISAVLDSNEGSVLTAVQLLWVNLIMDTLAALALATERPTPELLERPPESKRAPLINFTMWKMIIGQAFFQVAVNLGLLFGGANLFGFTALIEAGGVLAANDKTSSEEAIHQKEVLRTIVFNVFVLMQVFNEVK
jgi:Ca2+-transporting ATPase